MNTHKYFGLSAFAFLTLFASTGYADFRGTPNVKRETTTVLKISWENNNPVNVYVSDSPDNTVANARLLGTQNASGVLEVPAENAKRQYFILVDSKSNQTLRTAERLLPLERGSNFRDIGGYEAFGAKHVRWGKIYRSGGTPMLSDADLNAIHGLGLKSMVDLRSAEERVLAPSKIDGVDYSAYGYSFGNINVRRTGQQVGNGKEVYRNFPTLLAPQLRTIFADLLGEDSPLVFNCSAGQDRTGFVTAIILSALGVSRADIIQDYHLSTQYRRPENEMPQIDISKYPDNAAAALFARYQNAPNAKVPTPLMNAQGEAFLSGAFEEIESKWGSVDNYIKTELGLDEAKLARLRLMYLE